jgi:hypothetical protein
MSIVPRATRLLLCLFLLEFALCVGIESSGAQTSPQKAFISYSSSGINFMDLFLGKDKNFFREEGLEPVSLLQKRVCSDGHPDR